MFTSQLDSRGYVLWKDNVEYELTRAKECLQAYASYLKEHANGTRVLSDGDIEYLKGANFARLKSAKEFVNQAICNHKMIMRPKKSSRYCSKCGISWKVYYAASIQTSASTAISYNATYTPFRYGNTITVSAV